MLVGLEMDEQCMSPTFIASLLAHLVSGLVLGGLYFWGLWRNAQLLAEGGSATMAAALTILRFGLFGAILTFASLQGARPLLETTVGVMAARSLMLWSLREATS